MKFRYKILLILLVITSSLYAQDIPKPMSPPRLVNDFAGIFDSGQQADLETMLRAYNDTTSTQIYVVTIKDLQGYAPSDYATTLGQEWGVGQKGKDNGLVILIKPRIGNERGQVYIAAGYGVEHILNDARIGRIIDQYMLPYFQQGDYYGGAREAAKVIIKYLSGQFDADDEEPFPIGALVSLLVIILLFGYAFYRSSKNNRGNGNSSGRGGGMFFPPFPFGGGGRSSGGWGGGGFGGGGGGSFGGGGAGRSF